MARPRILANAERLPALAGGLLVLALVAGFIGTALAALLCGRMDGAFLGVIGDPVVHSVLRFTLFQAALSTALSVMLALPVASALARQPGFAGRRWLIRLMAVPMGLPVLIGALGLIGIFGRQGIINDGLALVGLAEPVSIYGLSGILIAACRRCRSSGSSNGRCWRGSFRVPAA